MTRLQRLAIPGLAVCLGLGALAGCTTERTYGYQDKEVPAGTWQLVAYDSCQAAIDGLRAAAKSVVGPYGLWSGGGIAVDGMAREDAAVAPAAPPAAADAKTGAGAGQPPQAPSYSGTNTHESGVDEPDLVKTDGRRIITVSGGTLRVFDAATRSPVSFMDLSQGTTEGDLLRYTPADLLIAGDHALVLMNQSYLAAQGGMIVDKATGIATQVPDAVLGPQLFLVDLVGRPRVLSRLTVDGGLVDARQVGSTARVVIRSSPRLEFPYVDRATDEQRTETNKDIIDGTDLATWLPRIEVTTGGQTERTEIGCGNISRPEVYSGTNMLTVLTIDVAGDSLKQTFPTTLVADGDTVYSNGPSLYVASDRRWRFGPVPPDAEVTKSAEAQTEVYKFDTSKPDRPIFVAGGAVPGYLINQYSMSEWDGHLRVATTTDGATVGMANPDQMPASESGVHVLAQRDRSLKEVGSVTGLGKGERIYAVRFTGPIGYVVTFRQTDPLYTVDLGDPTNPVVRGELKIPGYSAYLHPAGPNRLIGIGQDATEQGRVKGTQISLFDVGNLAEPGRLASYTLSGAHSEAEFDPHAFLYWPAESLLVVPLQTSGFAVPDASTDTRLAGSMSQGALVLKVGVSTISEIGYIQHPQNRESGWMPAQIRRSLVIDQTLWTVSDSGLMAHDIRTLTRLAWLPYN
jgi:hypothetical protein